MDLTDGVVRLRSYQGGHADIELAAQWYRDPEVLYYSEGPGTAPFSRERVVRMYQILSDRGELYMIDVAVQTEWHTVGDVTLAKDTLPIVIGAPDWRSRGIGGRVIRLLIQRARVLGWERLTVRHVASDNVPSQRLFMQCGFELVESGVDNTGQRFHRYQLAL